MCWIASIGVFWDFGVLTFPFFPLQARYPRYKIFTGRFKRLYMAIYLGIYGTETEPYRS